ncbi:hypothetical protein [Cohnella yongneupensis]|uniref:Uncharacterized protein n=1 Tax=Cohnella yongneupensis TaxID=425006 RepID=A0ABW0R3S8_9BACL
MSGQDVVRQTLEGDSNIVEVEVEYRKGSKAKYNLVPGNSSTRQSQIDRLLEAVRWEKVEEVEIEYVDGYKEEIDLEYKPRKNKKSGTKEVAEEPVEEPTTEIVAVLAEDPPTGIELPDTISEPILETRREEEANAVHPPVELAPQTVSPPSAPIVTPVLHFPEAIDPPNEAFRFRRRRRHHRHRHRKLFRKPRRIWKTGKRTTVKKTRKTKPLIMRGSLWASPGIRTKSKSKTKIKIKKTIRRTRTRAARVVQPGRNNPANALLFVK